MKKILGNISNIPSTLNNPFDSKKVKGIHIHCTESIFGGKWYISGNIEFQNGDTEGVQRFEGKDIMDVVTKIYNFLEQL